MNNPDNKQLERNKPTALFEGVAGWLSLGVQLVVLGALAVALVVWVFVNGLAYIVEQLVRISGG